MMGPFRIYLHYGWFIKTDYRQREVWLGEENTCTMKNVVQTNSVRFRKSQLIYLKIKRLLDILCSLAGMAVSAPVFLAAAIAVKVETPGGRIIYQQDRVGKDGRIFHLYKFRTMHTDAPQLSTQEFSNAQSYITHVGRIMRSTSIDELPQLWNVLIGDMSLVGPRPLILRERDVHEKRFRYGLYQIRPGITGMAQTHGRDDMDDDQKVEWDRKYVEQISFLTDFKLCFRTIFKVIQREGVRDNDDKNLPLHE